MTAPLYGFAGDENLYDDPAEVYERWADDVAYDPKSPITAERERPDSLTIEEWSATPIGDMLMPATHIIDVVAEHLADEVAWDGAYDFIERAEAHPEVIAAFTEARRVFAEKIGIARSADRLLRLLIVTWDADGEPLLDGEPMYRQAS